MTTGIHSPRPSSTSSIMRRYHDTGFPEPFSGVSNTTLPHPDANVSADAIISQEDINVDKTSRRHRHGRSFRQNRYKRTLSHGRITPEMQAMYINSGSANASTINGPLIEQDEDETATGATAGGDGGLGIRSPSRSSVGPPVIVGGAAPSTPGAGVGSSSMGRPSTSKDGDSLFSRGTNGDGDVSPTTSASSSHHRHDDGSERRGKKRGVLRKLRFLS